MLRLCLMILILGLTHPLMAQVKPGDQPQSQGDPVTYFDRTDEVMNAAIAEARATLPVFLSQGFTTDGFGLPTTMLKVAIPVASGDGNEIIWVDGLSRTSRGFAGYLANAPVDLGALQLGDYVEFSQAQINDWGIQSPNGRLYGHYTTRVIAGLPGNAHLWDLLEPDTVPPEWR